MDIEGQLDELDHAKDEFETHEEMAADYMMDEWEEIGGTKRNPVSDTS